MSVNIKLFHWIYFLSVKVKLIKLFTFPSDLFPFKILSSVTIIKINTPSDLTPFSKIYDKSMNTNYIAIGIIAFRFNFLNLLRITYSLTDISGGLTPNFYIIKSLSCIEWITINTPLLSENQSIKILIIDPNEL